MGEKGVEKFNGEGFHTWQTKLCGYLMKKQLWSVVKPRNTKATTSKGTLTRAQIAHAQVKDEQALGIIITSLHDNYVHFTDNCNTALEAWERLEQNFGAKQKQSKVSLKKNLYKLTMLQGEDISSLVNRLMSIITQLTYIKCQIPDEDQVAVLLSALPKNFDNIVTVLEQKDPTPTLQQVINAIHEEEKKLVKKKSTGIDGAYLVSKTSFRSSPSRSSSASSPSRFNKKCYECGKMGHLSKDCYKNKFCSNCGVKGHHPSKCENHDRGRGKVNLAEEPDESDTEDPEAECYSVIDSDIL